MRNLVRDLKPGESYPEVVRDFCISIHYHSPKAYEVLRKKLNNRIPHPHTIASWYRYSNIESEPGFHPSTFERLKKVSADVMAEDSSLLICSLITDEMYIRKQVLWSNQSQKYFGYVSYGVSPDEKLLPIANQAIVFMLTGINRKFEFPIGYHFITTLKTDDKTALFMEAIAKVTESGIKIKNLTFDGLSTNIAMCKKLEAQLNPYAKNFKPYILNPTNNDKIYIIFDNCHMEKLARNTLGNKSVIYDDKNERIQWKHLIDLERFSSENELRTHKLSRKHVEFKSSIMNVKIATETMSNSVADSLQFLSEKGVEKFQDVQATIRYIRNVNNLFDIFNSRSTRSKQVFKRGMSIANRDAIFEFFDEATLYMQNLKIDIQDKKSPDKVKRVFLAKSKNNTAYRAFLINMESLRAIFTELVEEQKCIDVLYTYAMSQDHLELFFGKIR